MNNFLVEVYVPSIGKEFDVFIPTDVKIHEVSGLLINAITKISDGLFIPEEAALCDRNTGKILDINLSADELKIRNASRLMLI